MVEPSSVEKNRILSALTEQELYRILPHLHQVQLPLGKFVDAAAEMRDHLYFPQSGIMSLVMFMADGQTGEIAMIGREGVVGSSLLLSSRPANSETVVQAEGTALALSRTVAMDEFKRYEGFAQRLLTYSQALSTQIAQTAMCNRHHRIEQQFARWILMSLNRLEAPNLVMTQDLIANMLGVRREGVSGAASGLQKDGIIAYSRGTIRVLDREALLGRACECYETVHEQYEKSGLL